MGTEEVMCRRAVEEPRDGAVVSGRVKLEERWGREGLMVMCCLVDILGGAVAQFIDRIKSEYGGAAGDFVQLSLFGRAATIVVVETKSTDGVVGGVDQRAAAG